MKKIYLLFIICIVSHFAFGQSTSSDHKKIISTLLRAQTEREFPSAARTTSGATYQHVVAQSTHDSMANLLDSVQLSYSAGMGSRYDYNTMIYPYNYTYNSLVMFNFDGMFTAPQVLADTYMHWTNDPLTLAFGLNEWTYSSYDSHKNLIGFMDMFTDSINNTNTNYVNSFSAANNITEGSWFNDVSGVADSAFQQYFTYNTTGQLMTDSLFEMHLGTWHLVGVSNYTYDGSNNLVEIDCYAQLDTTYDSTLIESAQYVNIYDSLHRLSVVNTNLWDNFSLAPSRIDSFQYTGTHTFNTWWREYQYDQINFVWAPMFYSTKSLNTAGLPYTINTMGFDSILNTWVFQQFDRISYNAYNNPDTLFEFDYGFAGYPTTPSYTTVYYYNNYTPTTSVGGLKSENPIVIYPNPASDLVILKGISNTSKIVVSVINSAGQIVCKQSAVVADGGAQLNVRNLVSGVYSLLINDEAGNMIGRQQLVKE